MDVKEGRISETKCNLESSIQCVVMMKGSEKALNRKQKGIVNEVWNSKGMTWNA